jgi:hypothetical protein
MSTLVGWWKGEDNAVDSVNGNNGTWVNPTRELYDTGYVGKCFKLVYDAVNENGVYPIIKVLNNSTINFSGSDKFIVEIWNKGVDEEGYGDNEGSFTIVKGSEFTSGQGFSLAWNSDYFGSQFSIGIQLPGLTSQYYSYGAGVISNNWKLFKITYDNGRWEFYIDNFLQTPEGGYQELIIQPNIYDLFLLCGAYLNGALIDEIKIYDDSIQPEYIMIKELECFLAKKQATYGAQGDDLTGDNYFPALPDSKVEIITAMTDIETVSATYDHDLAVRGFVNANAELSCYMRSLGDATEPDYALLARASGWAVAGPTAGKYTITPIVTPTSATGDDLEVWHYLGGIGDDASVLTKIGNVVGNWKITGDVGKPVVFALTGAKGIYVSQAAATMVTSVVKDRTLIPAALPVTVSINSVVYKLMKFSFEGGNTVEQYIDCAETYGFGDSEITKKKIKFAFTCYANAALANPLDAVIAGAVVADVSIIWGKALYKTKIVVDDPQFIDCKTVDVGGLTGWEVTGNATANDITITQNDDHV